MTVFKYLKTNLPEGYEVVMEHQTAILAHSGTKKEFVAWTKDNNNGVCWGHYYPYWNISKDEAQKLAHKVFMNK